MGDTPDTHAWAEGFVSSALNRLAVWPTEPEWEARAAAYAASAAAKAAAAAERWNSLADDDGPGGYAGSIAQLVEELIDRACSPAVWNGRAEALVSAAGDVAAQGGFGLDPANIAAGLRVFVQDPTASTASDGQSGPTTSSASDGQSGPGAHAAGEVEPEQVMIASPESMFEYSAAGEEAVEDTMLGLMRQAGMVGPLVPTASPINGVDPLMDTLHELFDCEDTVLTVADGTAVPVTQIRVVQQHDNTLCGYYTLTNAVGVMAGILAGPQSEAGRAALGRLADPTHFWRTYYRTRARLLAHVAAKGDEVWFPWDADYIQTESMERAHMEFLLTHLLTRRVRVALARSNTHFLYLPNIGALLKGTFGPRRRAHLDHVMAAFRASPVASLVACVGLATHWVTVAIVRDSEGVVSGIMLNSLNTRVLDADGPDLWASCLDSADSRWARKAKRYPRGRLLLWLQTLSDCKASLATLLSMAVGATCVSVHWIIGGLAHVLDSFDAHVDPAADPADAVVALEAWLDSHFPPKVIEDILIPRLEALAAELAAAAADPNTGVPAVLARLDLFIAFVSAVSSTREFAALLDSSTTLARVLETLQSLKSLRTAPAPP